MSNPVGRPLEYTDERIKEIALKLEVYTQETTLPFWAEFCYKNKVNRNRAKELCKKSDEFMCAYEGLRAKSEANLLRAGLAGKTNSAITALILKNHHDYTEKEQIKGEMEHTIFFEEIVRKAAKRRIQREQEKHGPNT